MSLTNESYGILIGQHEGHRTLLPGQERLDEGERPRQKIPYAAEQVLNYVLPAIAGVKTNVSIRVEHYDLPNPGCG